MENVACDFCGSDETVFVTQQGDKLHNTTDELFTIVKCAQCGLHYTNPRPEQSEIGRYYSEFYAFHASESKFKRLFSNIATKFVNSPLSVVLNIFPFVAPRFVPYIKPTINDPVIDYYSNGGVGDFLDIGCGAGIFAHFWGGEGAVVEYQKLFNVYGVEVSSRARDVLNASGIEAWEDLDSVPKDKQFGMIRMNWSLEHVHSPAQYFKFLYDHLISGGRAMISVPNYDGMIYKLAPDCVELPIHLYHFRPIDIKNYASRFGFKVVSLRTFSYPYMYIEASRTGLLTNVFSDIVSFKKAKQFSSVMELFDKSGLGNDMIVILEIDN